MKGYNLRYPTQISIIRNSPISDVIKELVQWCGTLIPDVGKLMNQAFLQPFINGLHHQRGGIVGKERTVVCSLEMQLQIWRDGGGG